MTKCLVKETETLIKMSGIVEIKSVYFGGGETIYLIICCMYMCKGVRVMVFNATFNNITVISWRSVLLVEKTGENHHPVASH